MLSHSGQAILEQTQRLQSGWSNRITQDIYLGIIQEAVQLFRLLLEHLGKE
jgi:hypothetical protein